MALDESLLEELGIGPVWVRRGTVTSAATPAPAPREEARPAGTSAGAAAPIAPTAAPVEIERSPQPDPSPASDAQQADAPMPVDMRQAPAAPVQPSPRAQLDADLPPLDAYDDLPWTDDAPAHVEPADVEAPSDVHTLDWDALAERVANCERCRLCERRTNTVFGVGDREADWMLIGEAPGENEDKQGEPFVGQAGKLLDNMLRALTLSRQSNVYIANVIKCRPPGNRNPELDEVARCEPYLQRQVELVKPKVIVAMGRFAAQSLLKNEASIASMRGRVHEYRGVPVIVTYHPAYLLRSLQDKSKAWVDLCLARKTYREALDALGVEQGADKGSR